MLGFIIAFWATADLADLLFAAVTTVYILVAIQLEERDIMREHDSYQEYKSRVWMFLPLPKTKKN